MLNDPHLKVIYYSLKSDKVFLQTDIKSGVAITLRNAHKNLGKIGIFTPFKKLRNINQKVKSFYTKLLYLDEIVSPRGLYRFSEVFFKDYPKVKNILGKGTGNMMVSNVFEKLPNIF